MSEVKNSKETEDVSLNIAAVNSMCFFVGMHNKPGMKPLDSNTMTGKVIDAIINELPMSCIKTNMCEVDYMPIDKDEILIQNKLWIEKYQPSQDSIIVLLGRWVHENFMFKNARLIIKLPHPASRMGYVNKKDYVQKALEKINEGITF